MDSQSKVADIEISPLVSKLRVTKEAMFWFRRRRHNDWTENYTLYRDKVQLNRLLQRQSVNIPLIKTIVKTLMTNVDEPPILYYTNLDNDEQAEVYYNEYWKDTSIKNKSTIKDIVDKRQAILYGRTFKAMNLFNGRFVWEVNDPQDWLVDRHIDPADIDSGRILCHEHIFKPLSSLTTNPIWDTSEVRKLQQYHAGAQGLIKSESNMADYIERQARMMEMGDIYALTPMLGETYIELNEFFHKEFNKARNEDEFWYTVTADDMAVLFTAPLEQVIGETKDHYWRYHVPVTTWGDETERIDFWSDGPVDALRTINKVQNAWFSQLIENRTLRNFGMTFFNSSMTDDGFTPQTFIPEPFGFYPFPAGTNKLSEALMHVEIPDLEDTTKDIDFLNVMAEKVTAATSISQGVQPDKQITLGEVKVLLANAQDRVRSMAVYYTDSWEEFGRKYVKMLEAAPHLLDETMIHKRGRLTKKMYTKVVGPNDWQTDTGFTVEVKLKADKVAEDQDSLQWLNAAKTYMPSNPVVDEEIKQKLLESANLSADKIAEALKFDKQQQEAQMKMQAAQAQGQVPGQVNGMQPNGQPPQLPTGTQPGLPPVAQPQQQPNMQVA